MLGIVIALESAFATQLYVRLTTLSQSAYCEPAPGAPPQHPLAGTQFQAKGQVWMSSPGRVPRFCREKYRHVSTRHCQRRAFFRACAVLRNSKIELLVYIPRECRAILRFCGFGIARSQIDSASGHRSAVRGMCDGLRHAERPIPVA
jgi:hypothetical protein